MAKMRTIKILWTGGFDSTFRIVQLSRLPVTIQPYYVANNRLSEKMELSAIKEIIEKIKAKPETQCRLLPPIYIQVNKYPGSEEVTEAFNKIKYHRHIGYQYEWLACFAKDHPGIEIGILVSSSWRKLLDLFGKLIVKSDEVIGDYYVVDTKHSSDDFNILFQNYHFPLAFMTKLDLKKKYIEWGCEDIMRLTWFCHSPIDGSPCGECNPCKQTIEDGFKERFSKKALRRYWKRKMFSPFKKIKKRVLRQLNTLNIGKLNQK